MDGSQSPIDTIPNRDVTVIKDPTDVWLLDAETIGDFRPYEQWERDRRFVAKAIYHHPLGRHFYMKNSDDPFGIDVNDTDSPIGEDNELELAPERPGQRYRVKSDETIWEIARAFKLSSTLLLSHNDIDDPKAVRPGMWLYIPKPVRKLRLDPDYRELENPRWMHVVQPEGTNKWLFGSAKREGDISKDPKAYPFHRNVEIVAVASVPVEGMTLGFYMDAHDYRHSPRITRGFHWKHLAEGKAPSIEELAVADAMLEDDRHPRTDDTPSDAPQGTVEPTDAQPDTEAVTAAAQPIELLEGYKDTFRYINVEESPEMFRLLQDLTINELDGAAPSFDKQEGDIFLSKGWFTYDGTPYYRLDTRHWFAIPTEVAEHIEDDPFQYEQPDLPTRLARGGSLSREERHMVVVAKTIAKYNKFRTIAGMLRRK